MQHIVPAANAAATAPEALQALYDQIQALPILYSRKYTGDDPDSTDPLAWEIEGHAEEEPYPDGDRDGDQSAAIGPGWVYGPRLEADDETTVAFQGEQAEAWRDFVQSAPHHILHLMTALRVSRMTEAALRVERGDSGVQEIIEQTRRALPEGTTYAGALDQIVLGWYDGPAGRKLHAPAEPPVPLAGVRPLPYPAWYVREIAGTLDILCPDIPGEIIFSAVAGSYAYGLETATSDVDLRGVYVAPAAVHWGLGGVKDEYQVTRGHDITVWEVGKFLRLALNANPNILEVLYSPIAVDLTDLGRALLDLRPRLLSRRLIPTYRGYAAAQFKSLAAEVEKVGGLTRKTRYNYKQASHLCRLLLAGAHALRHGEVLVDVRAHRDKLAAIKRGEWEFAEVVSWKTALETEFTVAAEDTKLPERPDHGAAEAFLQYARRHMADLVAWDGGGE